jgi:hypothetical protein
MAHEIRPSALGRTDPSLVARHLRQSTDAAAPGAVDPAAAGDPPSVAAATHQPVPLHEAVVPDGLSCPAPFESAPIPAGVGILGLAATREAVAEYLTDGAGWIVGAEGGDIEGAEFAGTVEDLDGDTVVPLPVFGGEFVDASDEIVVVPLVLLGAGRLELVAYAQEP